MKTGDSPERVMRLGLFFLLWEMKSGGIDWEYLL